MAPFLILISATPAAIADMSVNLLGILAATALISRFVVDPNAKPVFPKGVVGVLVVGAIAYTFYEWYVTNLPMVVVLGHFFLLVGACKLIGKKNHRDYGQIFVMSALLMLVAAITSGRLAFPLALAAFLFVGGYGLMAFQFDRELCRMDRRRNSDELFHSSPPPALERLPTLAPVSSKLSSATLGIAIGMFLFAPRVEPRSFTTFSIGTGPSVTGFSANMNVRPYGMIQESDRMVMRVQLTRDEQSFGQINYQPYFRGVTADRYIRSTNPLTGNPGRHKWVQSLNFDLGPDEYRQEWIGFNGTEEFLQVITKYRPDPAESLIYQEYWFDAPQTEVLFTMERPVEMQLAGTGFRRRIDDQTFSLTKRREGKLHYTVASSAIMLDELAEALAQERHAQRGLQSSLDQVGLHHPQAFNMVGVVSDQVVDLANRIAASCQDRENRIEVALAIRQYLLSSELTYSLDRTGYDPDREQIHQFLFERKEGLCVDYAQAMAVLCHCVGIPARVVNGYHGGEFNEMGKFYVVREKHAHSWVEIYVPGKDWVTMDPTPAQKDPMFGPSWFADSKLRKYLDYAQFQWNTTVLGYDKKQRRKLFEAVNNWIVRIAPGREDSFMGRLIHLVREQIFGRKSYDRFDWFIHYVVLALEFVWVILLYRLMRVAVSRLKRRGGLGGWRFGWGSPPRGAEVAFYTRILRQLAKKGYRRRPGQTPMEFAAQVCQSRPEWESLVPTVNAYYQVQFGAKSLTGPQREIINRLMQTLTKGSQKLA